MGGGPPDLSWWNPSSQFLPFLLISAVLVKKRGLSSHLRPLCWNPQIPISGSMEQSNSDVHWTKLFSRENHTSGYMTLMETEKSNPYTHSYKLQDLWVFSLLEKLILISFLYSLICSIPYSFNFLFTYSSSPLCIQVFTYQLPLILLHQSLAHSQLSNISSFMYSFTHTSFHFSYSLIPRFIYLFTLIH